MPVYALNGIVPKIDSSVYLASTAVVVGNVTIGSESSIWYNCVARGDADTISIGSRTNIQDLSMLHADPGKPLKIGDGVTVGHRVIVHGCTIENDCLIGMGAVIMNGAVIRRGSVVAAGAVVLEDSEFPPFSLIAGIPGSLKRTFDESILEKIRQPTDSYVERARLYQTEGFLSVVRD